MSKDWIDRPSWPEIEEIARQSRSAAIPGPQESDIDKTRSTTHKGARIALATAVLAGALSGGCTKPENTPNPVTSTPDRPSPTPALVAKTPTPEATPTWEPIPEATPTPMVENYGGAILNSSFMEQIASRGNAGLLNHMGMPSYLAVFLEPQDNQYTLAQKTLFALSYTGSRVTQLGSKTLTGSTPGIGVIEPIAATPEYDFKSFQIFRQKIAGEGVSITFSKDESLSGQEITQISGDYLTVIATLPDGRSVVIAENHVYDKLIKTTNIYYHLLLVSPSKLQEIKDKIGGFQIKTANWTPNQLDEQSAKAITEVLPQLKEIARIQRELEKVTFSGFDPIELKAIQDMMRDVIRYDDLWPEYATYGLVFKNDNLSEFFFMAEYSDLFQIAVKDNFFTYNEPWGKYWNSGLFTQEAMFWIRRSKISHELYHKYDRKNWPEIKAQPSTQSRNWPAQLRNLSESHAAGREAVIVGNILRSNTKIPPAVRIELERYISEAKRISAALLLPPFARFSFDAINS